VFHELWCLSSAQAKGVLSKTSLNISNLQATTNTIFYKTDFSNFVVSNSTTLLSSLNVSGTSNLNTVNISGNLNVGGTTTIIDTVVNNTSFNSFSVSGPSIYYSSSNVTIGSSLNVVGDINSSGLSVFNMNNNLNSLSSYSFFNISGISNNLNNLPTYSSLSISNLQATTNTIFYKTDFSNLVVSNSTTLLSSLNVVGNIIGSGTAFTNLNYNSILNPPLIVSSNNPTTLISTLNVSGITTLSNNLVCNSSLQSQPKILLSGREFYTGTFTSTDGIALLLGVNRSGNRQLWIADSANLAVNTTNPVLRIMNNAIDCVATDGTTRLPLSFGGGALTFNSNGRPVLKKKY
jgi:hypothetical protein